MSSGNGFSRSNYDGQAGFAHANDIFRDFFENFGGFGDDPFFGSSFGGANRRSNNANNASGQN